jgi:magnesium chelatase family protein
MSFARIYSAQPHLLRGHIVTIEVDITNNSLHSFSVVGLPDKAVDEAKDRMSSALKNSDFVSPKSQNQKVVISLSPADLKKEGAYFDLGMALGYLLSGEVIDFDPKNKLFLGELSLNGDLLPIKGTLPLIQEAKRFGITEVFLPHANVAEAALVDGVTIYGANNLLDVIIHLITEQEKIVGKINRDIRNERKLLTPAERTKIVRSKTTSFYNLSDIRGQETAKRGLEIAAAGGHNIAMYGPPGTGKTMLARAFSALLPDLDDEDIFEITGIHSIVGNLNNEILVTTPPFRAPHHTASHVAIIGGGSNPKPGEVTLAHRGVLFLDEFPEFDRKVIESLRQPLEDNIVSISRAKGSAIFPSNFILVAAMNPCPCGNLTAKTKRCRCNPADLARYERKLSGPIMDRIDLWVSVGEVEYNELSNREPSGESSDTVRARITQARDRQSERFADSVRLIKTNSNMSAKDINIYAPLDEEVKELLNQSAEKLGLSARAYHRIIKLARTIADLNGSDTIEKSHILEALQYRPKIHF